MKRSFAVILPAVSLALAAVSVAEAQIPRDDYLKYVPLTYPSLVRETTASREFHLYGDTDDPAYRDVAPKDGMDDARAAWLEALAVRFAPIMVRNAESLPFDFRTLFADEGFALHVDRWDLARHDYSYLGGRDVVLAELAGSPCPAAAQDDRADCQLKALLTEFGPTRGPLEPEVAGGAERKHFAVMYFDMPGRDEKTWKEEYYPKPGVAGRHDLRKARRVFVHPLVADAGSTDAGERRYEFVLQYWFFYPTNDGPNNHEGDWEHINVIVSRLSTVERPFAAGEVASLIAGANPADGDDPLVIRRIEYYLHHFVYEMDFASPNVYLSREAWSRQVGERIGGSRGERWVLDRIRERAWQDAAETRINTRPVVWIGGDAVGLQSVLQVPGGLKDRDGHASYPFRGYFKKVGPGVGERVVRAFDHQEYFRRPDAGPDYVEDYGLPERVAVLPDWERVADLVLTDPDVRRAWAWFVLPVRFGFPATPSPAAGTIAHADMGNVAPIGPAFNGAWNRTGDASGYALYDIARLPWAAPLGVTDSFFPRAGFLNAPVLYFMLKPPLDLVWRTLALPVRAATGSRQPTFVPANAPAERLASLEAGVMVTPVSEDFVSLFLNREQLLELSVRLALALPSDADDVTLVPKFPTVAAPVYAVVFHLSPRFSTESSFTVYTARVGFDAVAPGVRPVAVRADLEHYDYHGNLRFNILTGAVQPYVKYGNGLTWYRLKNTAVDGEQMIAASSPRFRPRGSWRALGFNETVFGGGVDVAPMKLGRVWLGVKAGYGLVHHDLGFEREAGVELSPELAVELAGRTYSVWRHEIRVFGTIGF